jgi:hypothetical protein
MLMVPDRLMYNDEDMVGALKDEFLYFPKAKHDDMMDCLAYVNQVMPSFTGTLQSGVPSAFPLDWVSALIRGEIFWDDVQDQTGLGREEIEAYVRDAKQVGRH